MVNEDPDPVEAAAVAEVVVVAGSWARNTLKRLRDPAIFIISSDQNLGHVVTGRTAP